MNASRTILAVALALGAAWATPSYAHCDTLDGPVVGAARAALQTGEVERALIWVRRTDEPQVRAAFGKARAARAAGAAPDGSTDKAFFATLVRVHREGEGEKYTGLKPAGTIAPPIALADAALAKGDPEALERAIVEDVRSGLHARFDTAMQRRTYDPKDVAAGRAYVEAYVGLLHHVERLHEVSAAGPADAHHAHAAPAPATRSAPPQPAHAH